MGTRAKVGTVSEGASPALVAHADWGSTPGRRSVAKALWEGDRYVAHAPGPVGEPETLLGRLRREAEGRGPVLVGFDFPIGVPTAYAARAGIGDFRALLPELGRGEWADFYRVAEDPEEIGPRRPFYPQRPGGTRLVHLLDALGVGSRDDLLRRCERARPGRNPAAPLFWTMGAQQVGKAAIVGWQRVLAPALADLGEVALWPFDGMLSDLLAASPGGTVVAETYPAEFYGHLGVDLRPEGKRSQAARRRNARTLLRWAARVRVGLSPALERVLEDGFGPSGDGEDPFDAAVGLFGMLNVLLGRRASGEPEDRRIRKIEGWMLGRNSSD